MNFRCRRGGEVGLVIGEKQYETLKDKGMSEERAEKIANSPPSNLDYFSHI